jgi:hypothetical protein
MQQLEYENFLGFEHVYLEDSYVLGIDTTLQTVTIDLGVVLIETHPLYKKPSINEHYCMRKGQIIFPNCKEFNWIKKSMIPATDAAGEVDYGNIDNFVLTDGRYKLEGSWGSLDIISDSPTMEIQNIS